MAAPSNSRTRCRKFEVNVKLHGKINVCFIVCSIILLCSIITTTAAQYDRFATKVSSSDCNPDNENVNCNKLPPANETPRQDEKQNQQPSDALQALINWLFGPPASSKVQVDHGTGNRSAELDYSVAKPEPKNVLPGGAENVASEMGQSDKPSNIVNSVSPSDKTSGESRQNNKKNIEITDIQASIGTELHTSHLHGDPSQVNLKDELDLVEKFDRSVKQRPHPQLKSESPERSGRLKREPYKPIKVPYTTTNSQENNILRQRQLLVSPFDQQMLALQQQQQAAAVATAAMVQQQQQMNNIMNGNRYTVLDDYDDDDDSDEESDEFDDLTRFGPPLIEHHHMYLRDGLPTQIPVVPVQRKLGWGMRRRSVPNKTKRKQEEDDFDARGNGRTGDSWRRVNGKNKKQAASLKNGHWFLDDYDLNSEFHHGEKERKNVPHNQFDKEDYTERLELDEEEHVEKFNSERKEKYPEHAKKSKDDKENMYKESRDSLCTGNECLHLRQDDPSSTSTMATTVSGTDVTSTMSSSSVETTTAASTDITTTASSDTTTASSDTTTTEMTTTTTARPKAPYKATLNCRCGTQSVRGQNSGNGVVIRYNVNPWLVAVSNTSKHLCSGSMINDRYILTSKSCVRNAAAGSLIATAGLSSQKSKNYTVSKIITNKNFNLALLKLNTTVSPSHLMRPVCLPIGKRFAGNYSTGTLVTFKRVSSTLQMVDTEVSILSSCNSTAKGSFCAGPPGSVKCGGDTGGVLMVYRGGYSYEQIGVVAGTVGCRSSSIPGVYTDIRKRTRWILNLTKDARYCKSPKVTDDDLISTTRFNDSAFEVNDDSADISEYNDFEEDKNNSKVDEDEEEEDDHSAEVVDRSSDEE